MFVLNQVIQFALFFFLKQIQQMCNTGSKPDEVIILQTVKAD